MLTITSTSIGYNRVVDLKTKYHYFYICIRSLRYMLGHILGKISHSIRIHNQCHMHLPIPEEKKEEEEEGIKVNLRLRLSMVKYSR